MQDEDGPYHTGGAFVNVGRNWSFEIDKLWNNLDQVEADGIASLAEIGLALDFNWSATVCALAFGNVAALRALIAEASR
jgi:hypothetical protein